jgi:hypothetical protein
MSAGSATNQLSRPPTRAVRAGLALFVVGLVFIAVDVVPFFFGDHNRPLWLNLACLLAPFGFLLAIGSALRAGRRAQRAALAAVLDPAPAQEVPNAAWQTDQAESRGTSLRGRRMTGSTSDSPETFRPGTVSVVELEFHVSELAAETAGAMAPWGDLELPLPMDRIAYTHPGPGDRPYLAGD